MNPLKFFPIYRRELKSYLTSPTVYVCVALFLFMSGLIFYGIMNDFSRASADVEYRNENNIGTVNFTLLVVRQVFFALNFLLIFIVPIFTMRQLAEEKKTGTFELLKSLPFTDWNIVMAKFLSAYTVVAGMLLLSGYYGLVMMKYGDPEMPVFGVAMLGALLASAAYTAIGLFASALSENQIVSAIVAFVLLLFFFLVGEFIPPASQGVGRLLEILSMRYHTDQFARGLLRLEDVAYFMLLVVIFLFLTTRTLELRRWRV
jgi:ABC-2 type transport system permease protein